MWVGRLRSIDVEEYVCNMIPRFSSTISYMQRESITVTIVPKCTLYTPPMIDSQETLHKRGKAEARHRDGDVPTVSSPPNSHYSPPHSPLQPQTSH
jgi:hypothetical protein